MGRADTLRRTMEFCRKHGHSPWKAEVYVPPMHAWMGFKQQVGHAFHILAGGQRWGIAYRVLASALGSLKKAGPGVRRDLYNFVDVVCLDDGPGTLYLQSTTTSGASSHLGKMETDDVRPHVLRALTSGNRVALVLWQKVVKLKKDGTPAARKVWAPRFVMIDAWAKTLGYQTTTTNLPYGWERGDT